VSFTPDLGTLSGSWDDPNSAARLFAATSALARLPPAGVDFWTDGSVVTCVGAGARFFLYVNSLLYASEAHPAGLESLDFRAEVVCHHVSGLGLAALIVFKDNHSYSSIRTLTDCQSLITTLSRGPACQLDSVCISIWSHLSSISKTCSIHIQWIPSHIGSPGNTLADLEAKRICSIPQTSVPVDLATAKVMI